MRALVFGCLLIAAAQASAVIPDPWAVSLQASADHLHEHQAELMAGASKAVMSKIMGHQGAAQAMATTMANMAKQRETGTNGDTEFRPGAGLADAHDAHDA